MKLSLPRADLVSALNTVRAVASNKSTLPILSNVALGVAGKKLELTASNLDVTIRTRVPADIDDPGVCTVSASLLYGLVSSFADDRPVELKSLAHDLAIVCGDSKYKLGILPAEEFPPPAKITGDQSFTVPQHVLHSLLAETAFCHGHDESRYILCGALLNLNGSLTTVGTDGRRVAIGEHPLEDNKMESSFILPSRAVQELLRLLSSDKPEEEEEKAPTVTVTFDKNAARFTFGDTVVTSKLIDGAYPNYRAVIPAETGGVPVGRTDLLGILKRLRLVSEFCTLEASGQSLVVRSYGTAKNVHGEGVESLLIPKSPNAKVNFNADYLIEALEAVDADEVILTLRDREPAVLRLPNQSWLCVTMFYGTADAKADEEAPKSPTKPAAKEAGTKK